MKLRLTLLAALLVIVVVGALALGYLGRPPLPQAPGAPPPRPPAGLEAADVGPCRPDYAYGEAADANAASLETLAFSPFGLPETGWTTYAPQVAQELGTGCGPEDTGFAAALARWQAGHGLPADGRMSAETFAALNAAWHARRPLRGQLAPENCPAPPPPEALATASPDEGYGGEVERLRPEVLDALRRMRAAARAEVPAIAADARFLTIVSGYRDPDADAARCAQEGNCDNIRRSACSAHRTGLVVDIFVGAAPGFDPASTDEANRRFQSRTAAYRWLVRNAGRFGFINYVFEPWHWEWNGGRADDAGTGTAGALS